MGANGRRNQSLVFILNVFSLDLSARNKIFADKDELPPWRNFTTRVALLIEYRLFKYIVSSPSLLALNFMTNFYLQAREKDKESYSEC